MEKEIWRPIKGYEDYYEVSNLGRIRSLDRITNYANGEKHLWKGRIMKIRKNTKGYLICNLSKNSKLRTITVHRLVAEAFIHNPNNLPEVNHKDEDKSNNCVGNLEWCDGKYNVNYGTGIQRRAETQLNSPKRSKPVLQLDINTGRVIAEYPSAIEAARQLNIFQGSISNCCNGKRKTYKGFKWRYKE